jgi:site-specific recombinase XerD
MNSELTARLHPQLGAEIVAAQPVAPSPAATYLARLAPGSRRTMRGALAVLAALLVGDGTDPLALPWERVRYPHTQGLRAALAERYAPATANKHLAVLRGVSKEAWRLGLMDAEADQRAVDVGDIRAVTLPRGRALTPGELRALFIACRDDTIGGVRDAALLAVLYGCGLRRAEVVALDHVDYHAETRALTVRHGKGGKTRHILLPPAIWREIVALRGKGGPAAPAFSSQRGGHLHPSQVLRIVKAAARRAGLSGAESPHWLRHAHASHALDRVAPIHLVRATLGHSSIATTGRYTHARPMDSSARYLAL